MEAAHHQLFCKFYTSDGRKEPQITTHNNKKNQLEKENLVAQKLIGYKQFKEVHKEMSQLGEDNRVGSRQKDLEGAD